MSVTRGDFLKQLGKSLPGMVLGSGVAVAAQKVLGKVAAVSGAMDGPTAPVTSQLTPSAEIEFIKHGPLDRHQIALTFDDGPTPGVTERILDELKRRELKATFFMIGQNIVAAPDLARRVLAEGHEIGNHTATHPKLTTLPEAEVEAEIQKTQDIIADRLHYRSAWFRPPYGLLRQNQAHLLQARKLRIVLWNVDPGDWAQPGEARITGTILSETKPGSIIVCHDCHLQTANSLPAILDGLIERGLMPITLSTLLGKNHIVT
jgi:peptidoglycan/xylan/chitin deacetylase (PgdA/CDA1 family)